MQNRNRLATVLLPLLCGALAAFSPGAARADNVYLTNGKSFEGVIAVVGESQVRIQMPGGEIRLPRSSVARIETADSNLAEFLRRKEALGKGAGAAEWLGLARWAKANDFDPGVREAGLKAATLDPHQPGLAPLLKPLGYVFDDQLDSFVPYADAMHRKGFVQVGGQWITREENAERARQAEAREASRASLEAAEASRRTAETLAQLALVQQVQASQPAPPTPAPGPYDNGSGYLPLGYGGGYSYFGSGSGHPHGHHGSHSGRSGGPWRQGGNVGSGYDQLVGRQPGSLFPLFPPGTGNFSTPSNSPAPHQHVRRH
jgi:hypothetical protein